MNISKLIDKGEQAYKKRNYDYAITVLLEAVNFAPDNRKARELLRKAALKKHESNYPSAGAVAIFGLPKKIGMFFSGLGKKSNPEAYMMACERYLMLDPKSLSVNIALGDAAAGAGHVQTAIVAYETASENHPEDVGALKKLGFLLWRSGDIQRAHKVFGRAVDLAPKDQEAVKARKNVAAEASLKETGFETAKSSRDLVKDKDASAKAEAGTRIHRSDDDLTTHRTEIEERLVTEPENADLLQDLAEICIKQKDFDAAVDALEKAVAASPSQMAVLFALGDAKIVRLEQLAYDAKRDGNTADVKRYKAELAILQVSELRERVKAYPTDLNQRFKLAGHLLTAGSVDEAIGELQRTVQDPKFKEESQLRMGQAFAKKGQYDLAIRQLNSALEDQSAVTERVKAVHYELGDIYETTGKPDLAKDSFGKIYEVDIGYRDVGDRLAKLDSTQEEGKLSLD